MGTVPDPLRSAKLALTTASDEENGLEEFKPPKHQQKQASVERSSNGYPCSAKVQPAGEQPLDMNCGTESRMPKGERHCGHAMSQSPMFSPGPASLSKEDCLVAAEPVKNSRQEGSKVCHAKDQVLTDSPVLTNAPVKESSTQEDCNVVQSGPGGPLCCKVDDKAVLSPGGGGGGGVMQNKTPANNSTLLPTHQDAQAAAPTVKETVGGSSGPGKTQALPSAKEQGPVSDPALKALVHLDTELMATKNASVGTVQDPLPKASLACAPQPLSRSEISEEASLGLSKFKDTGTMTVQLESKSADGGTVSRTHQDAEVQAVASVESRSASTSPSILAAFLRESMPSEAKQKQEQLHIIYSGASGKEHSEIIDNLAVLGQTALPTGIMPEVRIQAPAGAEKRLGAQAVTVRDDLASKQDAACSSRLDRSEHPCPMSSGRTQEVSAKEREVQAADGARSPGSVAQQLLDAPVLHNAQPVDRISVDARDQPAVPPQPANIETKLPPCPALSDVSGKHQNLGPSAADNPLASSSCPRVLESAKPPVASATAESSQQNQPQVKVLGDVETGPTSFHVGVKSQKEGTVSQPGPKEQKVNVVGASAGPKTVGVPVTAQTKQDIPAGGNREVEALVSQKKAAGRPESGLSSNSGPGLLAKIGALGKESKLALPASLVSAHPVPSPSRKKKEKPVPDTKVHVKHSKHVRDVVWDEQGMTWEVYGASLDPESLGIAIQNHLQRQIREHEKLIKAQSVPTRKSISSDTSSNKKLKGRQHNVFQSMLQNFRRPNCCVRPTASSVSD